MTSKELYVKVRWYSGNLMRKHANLTGKKLLKRINREIAQIILLDRLNIIKCCKSFQINQNISLMCSTFSCFLRSILT